MEVLKKFGELVRERRLALKLTQEKLAELCDLSVRQIVKIETGKTNIKLINLVRIYIECNIEIGELEQFYTNPSEDLQIGLCEIHYRK